MEIAENAITELIFLWNSGEIICNNIQKLMYFWVELTIEERVPKLLIQMMMSVISLNSDEILCENDKNSTYFWVELTIWKDSSELLL